MNVLDLFSGIGGFSLGLERAGMRTVAFCEIDPFCQRVLAKHWPAVPCYHDVRTLTAEQLAANAATGDVRIDVICGGFPCQDISVAGKGAGIDGERSGLWSEYARIIGEVRPGYVIVENVAALLARGLDRVLRDMATLGYHAEWHCIPASAVGAPHRRDRLWIVANLARELLDGRGATGSRRGRQPSNGGSDVADTDNQRLQGRLREILRECAEQRFAWSGDPSIPDADSQPPGRPTESWGERGQWLIEPDVGRVANGIPSRVDRLSALGNAVVPQIPEIIGRAIMSINGVVGSSSDPANRTPRD